MAQAPDAALDRAALAAAYLRRARAGGDPRWLERAEAEARRSLELLPAFNPGPLQVLAQGALARHEFREAARLAREALAAGGGGEATTTLLTALLPLGEVDEAEAAARALARRLPTPAALTHLALVLERRGRDDEARAALERAAERAEGEVGAWTLAVLARHHLRHGRVPPAHQAATRALSLAPDHALATQVLAEAEVRAGWGERALSVARRVGGAHGVQVAVAAALARAGRRDLAERLWEPAEAGLRAAVSRGEGGHDGLLAALLLDRGAPADVEHALRLARAERERRADPAARHVLARALAAAGELEAARDELEAALACGLRDPLLLLDAAALAARAGDPARAEVLRAQALEVDPSAR